MPDDIDNNNEPQQNAPRKSWEEIEREAQARRVEEDKHGFQPDTEGYLKRLNVLYRNKARAARFAEKNYYRNLSNSTEFTDLMDAFKEIHDYPDGTPLDREDRIKLTNLKTSLDILAEEWKKYTESYISLDNEDEEIKDERIYAMHFKESLDHLVKDMQEFSLSEASDHPAFREMHSFIENLEGHYDEMMNGSLGNGKLTKNDFIKLEDLTFKPLNIKNLDPRIKKEVFWQDRSGEPLFPHEPCVEDIIQGGLGNCYFLAGIASIVQNNPKAIRDMFVDLGDEVGIRMYHHRYTLNEDSPYNVRYDDNEYLVRVKKSVPVKRTTITDEDGITVDETDAYSQNALWVQMLEKAFAATGFHKNFVPGYEMIQGGNGIQGVDTVVGSNRIVANSITNYSADKKFEAIRNGIHDGHFITGGTVETSRVPQALQKRYEKLYQQAKKQGKDVTDDEVNKNIAREACYGLGVKVKDGKVVLANHEYSIAGAEIHNGKKYVIVRNPAGNRDADFSGKVTWNKNEGIGNGYLAIPLQDFQTMFSDIQDMKPVTARLAEDPTAEIARFSTEIMEGLKNSRTVSQRFSMRGFASQDFQDLYNAAEKLQNLAKSSFPSKTKVEEAVDKLTQCATKYYEARKNVDSEDPGRNLRMSIADAAKNMKVLYEKRKTEEGKQLMRSVEEGLLASRIADTINKDREAGAPLCKKEHVLRDRNTMKVVSRMTEDELFDFAVHTKTEKLSMRITNKRADLDEYDTLKRMERETAARRPAAAPAQNQLN